MTLASRNHRRFAITTGDLDGIGLEVTYKALLKIRIPKRTQMFVFEASVAPKFLRPLRRQLIKKFRATTLTLGSTSDFKIPDSKAALVFVECSSTPPEWVVLAAKLCLDRKFAGMITGPLSKTLIVEQGMTSIGHTEILRRVARSGPLNMGFLGRHFHVVLATGHVALHKLSRALTAKALQTALQHANKLRALLPPVQRQRPLALVGLNPHAGENGLIGDDEQRLYRPVLAWAKRKKIRVIGPLVPDAAFLKQNWSKYSIFVCPYHDQGLIPFKMVHGADFGAHMTLGLPFVRTSVDHGTAKDLFSLNRANPNSMIEALNWALRVAK